MVTAEEGDGDRHGCWRRRASGVVVVVCGVAVTLATGVAEQHHHHQWGWVPPIPITMTTAESSSTGVVAARRTHHRPARRRRILPENTTTHSRAPRLSLPSNKRRKRRRRMTPRGDLVGSHTATDPHCRHTSNEEEKCIVIVRFDESAILKRSWVNHTTDTNSSDSLVPRNEVTAAAVQQMAVELAGWIPGARILFMYQHAFLGVALTHVSYRRVTEALLLLHTMTTTTTTTSLNATSSSRNSGSISSGIHSVRQVRLSVL